MKHFFTLSLLLPFSFFLNAQETQAPAPATCDKVQTLLTRLEDFQGAHINDNAYACREDFIIEGFSGARVIVPGKESKLWTVNMNSDAMGEVEAESMYLSLVKELMQCVYLNSWKGGEQIVEGGIYHYNFKQSISTTGYYKGIMVSYYGIKNTELYKVEITLMN